MSDTGDSEDIDAIRERKKAELKSELQSADEPVHVEDDAHFEDLTGDGIVLVDFYADWCGPCKMLEPTVEGIAAETNATVAKVDVDEHQGLAGRFGVQGVPTLLLFVDGEQVEQVVGVKDKGTLLDLIERHA